MTNDNKLAKTEDQSVAEYLKENLRSISTIVPKNIDAERLARIAFSTIRLNPDLQNCSKLSLMNSIMGAAKLGLEVDPLIGQAYLVPYKGECTLIIGYKGLITLARRSGIVKAVYAHAVYEGDTFEYQLGMAPNCTHIRGAESADNKLTHVYAVLKFKDNSDPHLEVMDKNEVEKVRQRSKSTKGPWFTDYSEMAKKTVLRRALKMCPMIPDMPAEYIDEYGEVKSRESSVQIEQLTQQLKGE